MNELKPQTDQWFKIDNVLVDIFAKKLGITAFAIYVALKRHANKKGVSWPSQRLIAEELGITQRTVLRHIDKLEEFGLIEREKRRRSGNWANYRYLFNDREDWKLEPYDKTSNSVADTSTSTYVTKTTEPYDNSSP